MNTAPQIPAPLPWRDLQDTLAGSFIARAHGLLANSFEIQKHGSTVGYLTFNGLSGAEFVAGTLKFTIERKPSGDYEMFSGEDRILTASPSTSSLDALEIACGDVVYQARTSFLRNSARAFSTKGGETATLKGNVVGRRYEITVSQTDAALPIAVLLLYHTATFRRHAFVA